eukprot:scaffold674342_cov57-Prasinocladus_malaysianus.AAC.1
MLPFTDLTNVATLLFLVGASDLAQRGNIAFTEANFVIEHSDGRRRVDHKAHGRNSAIAVSVVVGVLNEL